MDYEFGHRLAWRVGQGDYQFIRADSSNINTLRLSTGIVIHIGMNAPPTPAGSAKPGTDLFRRPGDGDSHCSPYPDPRVGPLIPA